MGQIKSAANSLTCLLLRDGSHSHFLSQNVCPGEIKSPCKKSSDPVTAIHEETLANHEESMSEERGQARNVCEDDPLGLQPQPPPNLK